MGPQHPAGSEGHTHRADHTEAENVLSFESSMVGQDLPYYHYGYVAKRSTALVYMPLRSKRPVLLSAYA